MTFNLDKRTDQHLTGEGAAKWTILNPPVKPVKFLEYFRTYDPF